MKLSNWNANSVKNKTTDIALFIEQFRPDIFGLCETKLDDKLKFRISGYRVYRSDRNRSGGGVAIAIRNGIRHDQIPSVNSPSIESVGVRVSVSNGRKFLSIYSIYCQPKARLTNHDINLLTHSDEHVIVMGDFNSKHVAWNCPTNNRNGKIIIDYLLRNNINIYAPDEPTYLPQRSRARPSVVDFALVKGSVSPSQPLLSINSLSSDHNPIMFEIRDTATNQAQKEIPDYRNTDWKKFKEQINENLNIPRSVLNENDIDLAVDHLTETVKSSALNSTPLVVIIPQKNHIPNYIKTLSKIKNHFRHKFQKTRLKSFKNITKAIGKLTSMCYINQRNIIWQEKLKQVTSVDGSLWRVVNNYYKNYNSIPPIKSGNNFAFTDSDKANAFSNSFQILQPIVQTAYPNIAHTKHVLNTVKKYFKSPHPITEFKCCSIAEINKNIKKIKNKRSPGPDSIQNNCIKHLPRKAVALLTKIVNSCLRIGYFPSTWKRAKVVPIHKPGKPHDLPTSYRPISLLDSFGKITEKIVLKRLNKFSKNNSIIPLEQFGFKKHHSTIAQLARLTDRVTQNFNKKKYTGLICIDLEKAFDSVWHTGLVYKLIERRFPHYLVKTIHSYLVERSFRVHVGEFASPAKEIKIGVAQGSVLAPWLFNLYLHDIPRTQGVPLYMFADDTALSAQSWRLVTVINRLNKGISTLQKYFTRWKIKMNPTKSQAILLTRRRPDSIPRLDICPWTENIKYLGLNLDTKLTFTHHINLITHRAIGALIKLFPLLSRNSQLSLHNKLLLYKMIIRPSMTYASPAWHFTSDSNIKSLQVVQNKFLRIIGDFPRRTKIENIHKALTIEPISSYILKTTNKFFSSSQTNKNPIISSIGADLVTGKHKTIKHRL